MNKLIEVTRSSMSDFIDYIEEIKDYCNSRCLTNSGIKYPYLRKYFYLLTNNFENYQLKSIPKYTEIAQNTSGRFLIILFYANFRFGTFERICNVIKTTINDTYYFKRGIV